MRKGWLAFCAAAALPLGGQDKPPSKVETLTRESIRLLRQARKSTDPEVRDRASQILRQLERSNIQSAEDVDAIILTLPQIKSNLGSLFEFLSERGLVTIRLSPSVKEGQFELLDFSCSPCANVSLAKILDLACHPSRLRWTVRGGDVVIEKVIMNPELQGDIVRYELRDMQVKGSSACVHSLTLDSMALCEGFSTSVTLEEPEVPPLSTDDIVTLITEEVDPKVWEDSELYSISMTPNQELLVTAPKATHEKIRAYLQKIRRRNCLQWEARLWLVCLPGKEAGGLAPELDAAAWESLRQRAGAGDDALLLATERLTGYPGQTAASLSTVSHEFVRQYGDDGIPEFDQILEGVRIWIRGVPDDRDRISFELTIAVTKLLSAEKIQTRKGEVMLPEIAQALIRTTRQVPSATPIVLGRFPNYRGAPAGRDTLVAIAVFNKFAPE